MPTYSDDHCNFWIKELDDIYIKLYESYLSTLPNTKGIREINLAGMISTSNDVCIKSIELHIQQWYNQCKIIKHTPNTPYFKFTTYIIQIGDINSDAEMYKRHVTNKPVQITMTYPTSNNHQISNTNNSVNVNQNGVGQTVATQQSNTQPKQISEGLLSRFLEWIKSFFI